MTKTRRYRWTCPLCETSRLLGARPRKTATARYCLPCSEETGSLVEMTCPTLDKQRVARTTSRVARAATKRKREKARKVEAETWAGIHVPSEVERVWAIARKLHPRLRSIPRLILRERSGWQDYSGHAAFDGSRICLSMHRALPASRVRELIVHEISHPAAGSGGGRRNRRGVHDDGFWSVACELAEAAYGVPMPVLTGTAHQRAEQMERALRGVDR